MSGAMPESKRTATLILRVIQTLTDSKHNVSNACTVYKKAKTRVRVSFFHVFSPWPKKFQQGRSQLPHHGSPMSKIETRAAAIWIGIKMRWAAASRMVSNKLVHTHFWGVVALMCLAFQSQKIVDLLLWVDTLMVKNLGLWKRQKQTGQSNSRFETHKGILNSSKRRHPMAQDVKYLKMATSGPSTWRLVD